MKRKLPGRRSDKEAEDFVAKADLTEYDLPGLNTTRFGFQPKSERVNMRLPRTAGGREGFGRQGWRVLSPVYPPGFWIRRCSGSARA